MVKGDLWIFRRIERPSPVLTLGKRFNTCITDNFGREIQVFRVRKSSLAVAVPCLQERGVRGVGIGAGLVQRWGEQGVVVGLFPFFGEPVQDRCAPSP